MSSALFEVGIMSYKQNRLLITLFVVEGGVLEAKVTSPSMRLVGGLLEAEETPCYDLKTPRRQKIPLGFLVDDPYVSVFSGF